MAQGRSDCSVLLHFWDPVSNIIGMMTGQVKWAFVSSLLAGVEAGR